MHKWSDLTSEQRSLIKGLGGEQGVFIRPSIVRAMKGDGNAAIVLSHMLYWSQSGMAEERDGWFYLTTQRMTRDTGMSYDVQERVRRKLAQWGILEQERRGLPAKNYYRINLAQISDTVFESDRKEEERIKKLATAGHGRGYTPALDEENHPIYDQENHLIIVKKEVDTGVDKRVKLNNTIVLHGEASAKKNVLGEKLPAFVKWVQDNYPENAVGIRATESQANRIAARLGTIGPKNTLDQATVKIRTFVAGVRHFKQAVDSGQYDRKYVPRFDKWAGLGVQYGQEPGYIAWAERKQVDNKPEMVI